ncbi:hypothetical protein JRI60_08300 [Archangium violaceum]|uniref:hypothetical protein n=1 Tax=Archangium violaceum TaxID=83451 RepID=UPI00194F2D56|nr:hypothetical protein [Archangium violaceum]QRN99014.1 hypothetical protein JRI60_08300 [Archangium violaceum]
MKTGTKILGVVVLGAVLGGAGCAGTKEAARDVESAVPGLSQKDEGLVTSVDKDGNMIAVKSVNNPSAPPTWFALTPDTKMEREGRLVGLDDISEGTPVRVSYEPATGPEKTYKVEVLTGEKAGEVKAKAELQGQ